MLGKYCLLPICFFLFNELNLSFQIGSGSKVWTTANQPNLKSLKPAGSDDRKGILKNVTQLEKYHNASPGMSVSEMKNCWDGLVKQVSGIVGSVSKQMNAGEAQKEEVQTQTTEEEEARDYAKDIDQIEQKISKLEEAVKQFGQMKNLGKEVNVYLTELRARLPAILGATDRKCPTNKEYTYKKHSKMCYRIYFESSVSWYTAKLSCAAQAPGGRLAVLDTKIKFVYPYSSIRQSSRLRIKCYWIGAKLNPVSNKFFWLNDKELPDSHKYWSPSNPNNKKYDHCVSLYSPSYKFSDSTCSRTCGYICEHPMQ